MAPECYAALSTRLIDVAAEAVPDLNWPLDSTADAVVRRAMTSLRCENFTPGPSRVVTFDGPVDPMQFLGRLLDRYGEVVRYQTAFGPCFLFVHPEHVRTILQRENYQRASLVKMMLGDGLLASDGPRWRSQRRIMQRDFAPKSISPLVSLMARHTSATAGAWQAAASAGKLVDVTTEMTHLTLRIIVDALFSQDLSETRARELCVAVTQAINELSKISWTIFGLQARFTPNSLAQFTASKSTIDSVSYDLIARRRALSPADRPRDLLTTLIEADTDDGPMSDLQIRDEIVTMLVGGHETTALALAWAWKAIAEAPGVERALHAEVDAVSDGRIADLAQSESLPWTRAVLHEALRLYPPVWYMARVASEDDSIDGHAIPRGACVLVSAWFTQRHPSVWRDAERFDPSRFLGSEGRPPHREAYFPFGSGRHLCLGMQIALLEGTLILAQLARSFRVRPIAAQQIHPNPGITLRQSPGMMALIEARPMPSEGCLSQEGAR
jgi:cytochrome P450